MDSQEAYQEIYEKRGLWDNIHAKRERIERGSGEKMRKPGSEGAPTEKALRQSQTEEVTQRAARIINYITKKGKEASDPQKDRKDVEKMSNTRRKVVRNLEEEHDLFDVVYNFLISENLTEQEVLDIMTHVSIDEILDLIEEYQDLTPEKEERVKNRVGELARDIELSAARVRELRKKPFAKHRPGIRKQAAEILKNAKKKQKLVQNASDALIRTSTSRSAKIQKRIEDLKNS